MRKTRTEQGRAETASARRAYGARQGKPLTMLARRGTCDFRRISGERSGGVTTRARRELSRSVVGAE